MKFILTKELQQRIKKAFRKLCWKQSRGKPDERMGIDKDYSDTALILFKYDSAFLCFHAFYQHFSFIGQGSSKQIDFATFL